MTISQRVFYLLKEQGKKQNELAKFTGISTSTISAWNTRGTNPAVENIVAIANFFDVSVEYLLTGEEKIISKDNINENEQQLLKMYRLLTEREQGEYFGELKEKTKNRVE